MRDVPQQQRNHGQGKNNNNNSDGPATYAALVKRLQQAEHVFAASADMTPELEGEFFARACPGKRLVVLYKQNGRSAANTRCIELTREREAWEAYTRILLHNRAVSSSGNSVPGPDNGNHAPKNDPGNDAPWSRQQQFRRWSTRQQQFRRWSTRQQQFRRWSTRLPTVVTMQKLVAV
jgi:hypothetical protein